MMSNITKKALALLAAMMAQAKINAESNTDEQALKVPALYPNWEDLEEGTELVAGQRVNYEGVLHNVLQNHKKQLAWTPTGAPSLFAKVLIPDENVIPEWEQPGATNGYKTGDNGNRNTLERNRRIKSQKPIAL